MAAYWALATQRLAEVWLLPTYQHPFGKALASFEDRIRMCELAIAPLHGVTVCSAEAELKDDPLVGRTARTLEHLVAKHPQLGFALIVGADVLGEADKWYRWDRVTQLARIVVVAREGYPSAGGQSPALPAVSSSAIRERIARGEDVSALVPSSVAQFIRERNLYRE
jgi:nicotinate-nucleotide adenylyltransferase